MIINTLLTNLFYFHFGNSSKRTICAASSSNTQTWTDWLSLAQNLEITHGLSTHNHPIHHIPNTFISCIYNDPFSHSCLKTSPVLMKLSKIPGKPKPSIYVACAGAVWKPFKASRYKALTYTKQIYTHILHSLTSQNKHWVVKFDTLRLCEDKSICTSLCWPPVCLYYYDIAFNCHRVHFPRATWQNEQAERRLLLNGHSVKSFSTGLEALSTACYSNLVQKTAFECFH